MQKALEQWKIESGVVQRKKLWQQYEKTTQEIRARQAAVEEKKIKAAQRAMEHRTVYNSVRHGQNSK